MEDKDKFGVKMEEQLDAWQKKIEEKKAEAENKGREFWERVAPDFDALGAKFEEARYKLKLFRMSGSDALDELKGGFEKAFDEFKNGVENAFRKF